MEHQRSFTRTNEKRRGRDLSLCVRDRPGRTDLRRSASTQLLQTTEVSSFCENFRFTGFDKNLLENSLFKEFLSMVHCPFCLKSQTNKTILIKHLDEDCSLKMKARSKLYAIFQILPSNAVKCNICPNIVLDTIADYFFHLHYDGHILKRSEVIQAGKEFTDLLYCSRCKILVSNTYIQLRSHIQNRIHEIRRKISFRSDYSLRKSQDPFVACLYNADKQFKCLLCPFNFLFNTFEEIIDHAVSSNHMKNIRRSNLLPGVYCCFCDEEVNKFEIRDHFTSEEHEKNENSQTLEGHYDLCLYCGFACSTRKDLFTHMKLNCWEINEIRRKNGWTLNEGSKGSKKRKEDEVSSPILDNERHILVKRNINISKLLKVLQKFGEIICIKPYSDEYLLVEFRNNTAVESLLLVQDFIKIQKGVDLKFLEGDSKE